MMRLVKKETIPLILGIVLICSSLQFSSCHAISSFTSNRTQIAAALDQIDEYLVENVKTDDIETNVNALRDFKRSLLRNNTLGYNNEIVIPVIDQINDQILLPQDLSYCNREGYEIIRRNNIATDNRLIKRHKSRFPLQRVELILHHYATKHALSCYEKYRRMFRSLLKQMNTSSFRMIDAFIEAMMMRRLIQQRERSATSRRRTRPSARRILRQFMELQDSISNKADAAEASEVIKELTEPHLPEEDVSEESERSDESSSNSASQVSSESEHDNDDNNSSKSLVWKYLIDPCREYVQTFGPDIFMPIKQDSSMLPKNLRQDYDNSSKTLLLGRIRFGFCTIVLRDRYYFANLVADVAATNDS